MIILHDYIEKKKNPTEQQPIKKSINSLERYFLQLGISINKSLLWFIKKKEYSPKKMEF